jgi:type 1 glutamine amidotransferase
MITTRGARRNRPRRRDRASAKGLGLLLNRLGACLLAGAALAALFVMDSAGAAESDRGKARILLVTGIDYPGHLWRQTAPVLAEALRKDTRLEVVTVEDPSFLESPSLQHYDAVILHFQTWEQPGPGAAARENLRRFVAGGKGVVLVHFACGAWHKEWPEFEKIAGRVWFGQNPGPGKQQHDPYGRFKVEMLKPAHEIARGLEDFETQDELYTCLTGDHPIEVVAQAKSKTDNQYYPMGFVSRYEKGRTFHSVLGHDVKALSVPGVQELYRRGCAWAAGLPPAKPPQ